MNYVVTIDKNNVLTEKSRESMICAATRWKAQFQDITTDPSGADLHCHYWKFWAFDACPAADRIFYIDADTLIRNDAPSPFEVFPDDGRLRAVKDGSPRFDNWFTLRHEHVRSLEHVYRIFGVQLDPDRYINAGVMLLSKSHQPVFQEVRERAKAEPTFDVWGEQTYTQYVAHRCNLELIPEDWNLIQPWQFPQMSHWVYHFAGSRSWQIAKTDYRGIA